jgi:hypothetical protein
VQNRPVCDIDPAITPVDLFGTLFSNFDNCNMIGEVSFAGRGDGYAGRPACAG